MSRPRWILVLIVGCMLLIARSPDLLLHPALLYESGKVFYIETWFSSPLALFTTPYAGYLQTFGFLVGYLERLVNPATAPLVGNLVSLAAILFVAAFLVSERMAELIPNRRLRLLLAAFLIALPMVYGSFGHSNEVDFYLGLWMLLLVLATPARSLAGRLGERALLVIVVVSGPFSTLFAPLYLIRAWLKRSLNSTLAAIIVCVGGLIQGLLLLLYRGQSIAIGPTYSILDYVRIGASRLLVQPLIGTSLLADAENLVWPLWVALIGLGVCGLLVVNTIARLPKAPVFTLLYGGAVVALAGIGSGNTGSGNLLIAYVALRYFLILGAIVGGLIIAAVVASACIGGPTPCVVQTGESPDPHWDIYWPGLGQPYLPWAH